MKLCYFLINATKQHFGNITRPNVHLSLYNHLLLIVPKELVAFYSLAGYLVICPKVDSNICCIENVIIVKKYEAIHGTKEGHYSVTPLINIWSISGERNLDIPPSLVQFDINKAPTGEKGVLSLIVNKLHARDDKSVISFWITRAMEAFLRGETSAAHQLFLINKNVIEVRGIS